jgi:hypothetical protein
MILETGFSQAVCGHSYATAFLPSGEYLKGEAMIFIGS